MQLTQQTDFALRMLVHLSAVPDGAWVTVQRIADLQGLSSHHLLKIAHHLAQHGWIETRRGAAGGVRLAVPPTALTVGEVVRRTEPNFALVACMRDPAGPCALTAACRLKIKLADAKEAFLSVLDGLTLADCSTDPAALRLLVGSG